MTLPEGYQKLDEYKLTRDIAIIFQFVGNVAAIFVLYLFNIWSNFSLNFWNINKIDFPFYIVLLFVLATFVLHELVHGLGVKWAGGKPKYGAGIAFWVMPYFYCTSDDFFPRNKFIFFAALPSLLLTPIGLLLIFFLPQFSNIFTWAFTANFVGGVGDAWLISNVLRYPNHVYIKDEKHSNIVYGRSADTPILTKKKDSIRVALLKGLFEGIMYSFFISIILGISFSLGSPYLTNLPTSAQNNFDSGLNVLSVVIILFFIVVRTLQARKISTSH
jgi:hypothetical protein